MQVMNGAATPHALLPADALFGARPGEIARSTKKSSLPSR